MLNYPEPDDVEDSDEFGDFIDVDGKQAVAVAEDGLSEGGVVARREHRYVVPGTLGEVRGSVNNGIACVLWEVVELCGCAGGECDAVRHAGGHSVASCSTGTSSLVSPVCTATRRSRKPGSA